MIQPHHPALLMMEILYFNLFLISICWFCRLTFWDVMDEPRSASCFLVIIGQYTVMDTDVARVYRLVRRSQISDAEEHQS